MPARSALRVAPPAATGIDYRTIDRSDRTRLGGPGLRTFAKVADGWGLSERDRLAVLGQPGRSTYHGWLAKAQAGRPITLPLDTLVRISALLGIYKALRLIFARDGEDLAWLHAPNTGPLFGGRPPLELLVSGGQDALVDLRRYLDAWRGGQAAGPLPGHAVEHQSIADDDLVFA